MKNCVATLSLLLACGVSLAQTNSGVVGYTTPAIPLRSALEALSKVSGQKLLVDDELAGEPVVLRLNQVPLKDLEDKLAQEFVGEWVPTKDGLRLTRTPVVKEAFQKELDARRLAAFQKSIDELAPLAKSAPMDDNEVHRIAATYVKMLQDEKNGSSTADGTAMRYQLGNRTADMRLLAAMVVAIGAEKFSSLPLGRHVFSLSPTPTQLPIEGFDSQILDQYVQQRNLLAKAINDIIPKGVFDGYLDAAMASAGRTAKGPVRPLLSIDSDPRSDGSWLNLDVYDSSGEAIISLGWSFGNSFKPSALPQDRAKMLAASKNDQQVELSPAEANLVARYASSAGAKQPLDAEATELLAHPEDHEPLSIAFSRIVLSQAEHENRNLIASVADDDWRLPRADDKVHVKPSTFEATMTIFKRAEYVRTDGWLVITNKNPVSSSYNRIDRSALGVFTRAYIERGYVTLEDWATLATHIQPYDEPTLAWDYWNILRGERGMDYVNSWDALRLYGALGQSQLEQLSAGGSLSFHTLSADEQEALARIVYEGYSLRSTTPPAPNQDPDNRSPMLEGIEAEATESVPNGVPDNAVLTAKASQEELIYVNQEMGGGNFARQMSLDELAVWLVQDENPRPGDDPDMKVDAIRVGTKRTITFDLVLSDKVQAEAQLREDQFQKGGPISPSELKDKLPPEMWAKLQKAMATIREQRKHMSPIPTEPPTPTAPPVTR